MLRAVQFNKGPLLDFLAPAYFRRLYTSRRDITVPSSRAVFNEALAGIHRGIKNNDIQVTLEHWQKLQEADICALKPVHLHKIARHVGRFFFATAEKHREEAVSVVQDIATRAAAQGSVNTLKACMLFHIKQSNPHAVLDLYHKYIELKGEPWHERSMKSGIPNKWLATEAVADSSYDHGHIQLFYVVLTAHAMLHSFRPALAAFKAAYDVHLQQSYASEMLKFVEGDISLKSTLKKFLHRLHIAALAERPPSLAKHIANLADSHSENLEQLYNHFVDAMFGEDPYVASTSSGITSQKLVALTDVGWAAFLSGFLKMQRRDLAAQVWRDIMKLDIVNKTTFWTALFDAYNSIRAVDEAIAAWKLMQTREVEPDGLTYRAVISALLNGHRPNEAMMIFKDFQTVCSPTANATHTLSVYNTVISGLLRSNRLEEVKSLMNNMRTQGTPPDLVSFNTILSFHARQGDFRALADVVNQMTLHNITGDVFTFSTILSALLKVGRNDAPELMLSLMKKQGIQPNVAIYTAILDHQLREQDEKHLHSAIRILNKMEEDPTTQPNQITYTAIVAGLYRGTWLPPEHAKQWKDEMVARMTKQGMKFTVATYHILLRACLAYPHKEGLQEALLYYEEMKQKNIPLSNTTWYILLAGLLQRGNWDEADKIVHEMRSFRVRPTGALLHLVGKVKRRLQ